YAPASSMITFAITPAMPKLSVVPKCGTFNGKAFPATAIVTGVSGTASRSLEGVYPTLTYYTGTGTGGTPLAGAPSRAGTYTVVASFAGSANYAGASTSATFTIALATPRLTVCDDGGTYNGQPFTARATVAGIVCGVDDTPGASLEGVSPTFTYY